jgi:hypothetical protein
VRAIQNGSVIDVGRLPLRDRTKPTARPTVAKVLFIKNSDYIHVAALDWTKQQSQRPMFNWLAVFNFHADATTVAIDVDSKTQALMQVKDQHVVRCGDSPRAPLAYISFLEVAPWNKSTATARRFSSLGAKMVLLAIDRSRQLGTLGRVGLHAVPDAENFYAKMGFKTLDCPNEYNEVYYELSADEAAQLSNAG